MRFPVPRAALLALLALVLAALAAPAPAHADPGDEVRLLEVTYTVTADGGMDVDYRIDHRFGSDGRHGITFSLATGEPMKGDTTRVVSYPVTGLRVDDGQGHPVPFTSTDSADGAYTSRDLRIGDPDRTVTGRAATYRVRWHQANSLRTVGGAPLFDWAVTSEDFPVVTAAVVRVTAPATPTAPTCRGPVTCTSAVSGTTATFRAGTTTEPLSVAVTLPKGSVVATQASAARPFPEPVALSATSQTTLDRDGTAHVVEDYDVMAPSGGELLAPMTLRDRALLSSDQDLVVGVTGLAATVDGRPVAVRTEQVARRDGYHEVRHHVPLGVASGRVRLRLSYTVTGAVNPALFNVGGQPAVDYRWPATAIAVDAAGSTLRTVTGPAPAAGGDCSANGRPPARVAGNAVTCRVPGAASDDRGASDVSYPASAFPTLASGLVRSEAVVAREQLAAGMRVVPLTVLLGLLVPLLPRLLRRRHHAQRFAATPPGVVAAAGTPTVRDRLTEVPVRFSPPEATLAQAASVLEQDDTARTLAAVLVAMDVEALLDVQGEPFEVRPGTRRADGGLELALQQQVPADGPAGPEVVSALYDRVRREVTSVGGPLWEVHDDHVPARWVALAAAVAASLVAALTLGADLGWGSRRPHLALVLGLAAVALGAVVAGGHRLVRVRTALGTALFDQARGFRTYLTTAEADQLRLEEDVDVFSRYLPWAILFDEADRWASLCRQAAARGSATAEGLARWERGAPCLPGAVERVRTEHAGRSSGRDGSDDHDSPGGRRRSSWASGRSRSRSSSGTSSGGVSLGSW